MGAGKGDFPRNVGEAFRKNFDSINWSDEVIPEVPSQPSQE
jgi:hypothetical protein